MSAPEDEGRNFCICLNIEDCDEVASAAVSNGAEMITSREDPFYGERS